MLNLDEVERGDVAVVVGGTEYRIPKMTELPLRLGRKLRPDGLREWQFEVLEAYMPAEVVESLTSSDVRAIFEAMSSAPEDLGNC